MRLSSLSTILTSCSLAIANVAHPEWKSWNATSAQPTTASVGFSSMNSSSSFEATATVYIQIGDLSGFGVIGFSDIPHTGSGGMSNILIPTSTMNAVPCQTDVPSALRPNTSVPYTNISYPYQTRSLLNVNSTWEHVTSQSSVIPVPTTSPTDLGLFAGSGAQIDPRLPSVFALLIAVLVSLLLI